MQLGYIIMDSPILDWPLSIKLAGNNAQYAREFLQLLAKDLSIQLETIRNYVSNNEFHQIKSELHKLLGALSYSGALRLRNATRVFYDGLPNNVSSGFVEFENEALLFIAEIKQ